MICIVCKRKIERSYGAPGLIGCYCEYCAKVKGLTPEQIMRTQYMQAINELTAENARLRAEVSVKKKLLDEAENRYNETAKRFYKEGVKDMKSEIKKTLSALCKGDVSEIHRMIDQIAKEMLEGE